MPDFNYYNSYLSNANVIAFLKVLREGESGGDYSVIYRGNPASPPYKFDLKTGCPHPVVTYGASVYKPTGTYKDGKQQYSSAAGAYQFVYTTWKGLVTDNPFLTDFYIQNQDIAALINIKNTGALQDIVDGNIDSAFSKLRNQWTSTPYGAAAQYSLNQGLSKYQQYGGTLSVNDINTFKYSGVNGNGVTQPVDLTSTNQPFITSLNFSQLEQNIQNAELDDTTVSWGNRSNPLEESDFIGLKQYIIYLISKYYPHSLIPFVELIPHFALDDITTSFQQLGKIKSTSKIMSELLNGVNGNNSTGDSIVDVNRYNRTNQKIAELSKTQSIDLYNYDPFEEFSSSFNTPNDAGTSLESLRGLSYKIYGNLVLSPAAEQDGLSKPGAIGLKSISIEQGSQTQNGMTLITVKILDVQGNKLLDVNSPWSFLLNMRADASGGSGGDFWFRYGWQINLPKYKSDNNYADDPQAGKFWNHPGWAGLFFAKGGENSDGLDSGQAIKSYLSELARSADDTLTFTQNVTPESLTNPGYKKLTGEDGKVSYYVMRDTNKFDYYDLTLIQPEINVNPHDGSVEATLVFRTLPAIANCICPLSVASQIAKGENLTESQSLITKNNPTLLDLMNAFVKDNYIYAKYKLGEDSLKDSTLYFANSHDYHDWITVIGGIGTDNLLTIDPKDIPIVISPDQKNALTNATNKDTRLLIEWVNDVLNSNNMALMVSADKSTGGQLQQGFLITYDNDQANQLGGTTQLNSDLAKKDPTFGDFLKMIDSNKNNSNTFIGERLRAQDDVFSFRFQGSLIEGINVQKLQAANQATYAAQSEFANQEDGDNKDVSLKDGKTTDENSNPIKKDDKISLATKERNLNIIYSELLGLKVKALCHPWLQIVRPCYVKGMGFFDGKYTVTQVTHELDDSGKFISLISANRIPNTNVLNQNAKNTLIQQFTAMNNPGAFKAETITAFPNTSNQPVKSPYASAGDLNLTGGLDNIYNNSISETKLYPPVAPLRAELEAFIKDLHPLYKNLFRAFINDYELSTKNFIIITSGYRSLAQQTIEYNSNRLNARPGYSAHNYGLAIDINIQNSSGAFIAQKDSTDADWEASSVLYYANKYGLNWGGNFTNYHDRVHFGLDNYFDFTILYNTGRLQFGWNDADFQGNRLNFNYGSTLQSNSSSTYNPNDVTNSSPQLYSSTPGFYTPTF